MADAAGLNNGGAAGAPGGNGNNNGAVVLADDERAKQQLQEYMGQAVTLLQRNFTAQIECERLKTELFAKDFNSVGNKKLFIITAFIGVHALCL